MGDGMMGLSFPLCFALFPACPLRGGLGLSTVSTDTAGSPVRAEIFLSGTPMNRHEKSLNHPPGFKASLVNWSGLHGLCPWALN
ncbi:hypothetical protein L209DRAFT_99673 [Thermothelomyces heterothallicus CBS 203.75]